MKSLENLFLLCLFAAFSACNSSSVKNVTTIALDDSEITVCDESEVKEKQEVKLSDLVEDFQIIQFENKEEAFFKSRWFFFSDNYICVRQDGKNVKMFDKSGKYIADVGEIGQGPGEYKVAYDVIIDEKGQSIYISEIVSRAIMKYDMNGNFIRNIRLGGGKINKGRLFIQPDETLLLAHLCFIDMDNVFTAANIQLNNNDSAKYIYTDALASIFKDKENKNGGYNNEIWSYRNASGFPFMMTFTDTLYHYNSIDNEVKAVFTMKMDPEKKGDSFFIYNEFPHYYVVIIVGKNGKLILVDKNNQEAFEAKIVNDFMGNLDVHPSFQDGYYFKTYEPSVLKEKLEEQIASGKCPEEQIAKLTAFKETLKENDNNVLFLGKLKQ